MNNSVLIETCLHNFRTNSEFLSGFLCQVVVEDAGFAHFHISYNNLFKVEVKQFLTALSLATLKLCTFKYFSQKMA